MADITCALGAWDGTNAARLSLSALCRLPRALQPAFDPRELSVGSIHLGVGAFHRAHQAVLTQEAMEASGALAWGVLAASERTPAIPRLLEAQDCLYSLGVKGKALPGWRVVATIREAVFAPAQWPRLEVAFGSPDVSLVTLTVSEKGYRYDPVSRELNWEDEELAADLLGRPPKSVVGQLARGLEARFRACAAPMTVLCCDNLVDAGRLLEGLVVQFIDRMSVEGGLDRSAFRNWVSESVSFPLSVVDRIVPAAGEAERIEAGQRLGFSDLVPVVTEPYCQWVLEGRFAAPRPAWQLAGALFVNDVAPYQRVKLRLLNATHSLIAYLGALSGHETIAAALEDEAIRAAAEHIMREFASRLESPGGLDLATYQRSVLERFANRHLSHRTLQVAMDGSQKLPLRVLEGLREARRDGDMAFFATLAVASWIVFVAQGEDDVGRSLPVDDPLAEWLLRARGLAPAAATRELLQMGQIFGSDLPEDSAWVRLLEHQVKLLWRLPHREGLRSLLRGQADA
jgi:fructuronate reductase